MAMRQVLTIEDDSAIRRGIVDALKFAGFSVLESSDGAEGLEMAIRCDYDLLLLDLVLPKRGGLEILREVRGARPSLPIIVLSARGEEQDRVSGLRLGADDYVVKPFSVKELLARVEAVLRRTPERPGDIADIAFPGGRADFQRREVRFHDGQRIELSEREAELLRYFICIRAGQSRVTNCYPMFGGSVREEPKRERLTCISPGSGKNYEMMPMSRVYC
jgi:DNA-binding response OmpR family regulator